MPVTPDPSRSHATQYYSGHFNAQLSAAFAPEGVDRFSGRESAQVLTHGIGKGTAALRKQWALDTTQNIQNPPFSVRRSLGAASVPLIVWFDPGPGDQRFSGIDDPKRPYQYRVFKTGPAFALSKTIRGVSRDGVGAVLPFCKVLIFRASDNVLIAQTVSDSAGNYSVTVPS